MAQAVFSRNDIQVASRLAVPAEAVAEWSCGALAGRLTEVSGAGAAAGLTLAFGLVLDAQRRGEPAAWLTTTASAFYPPDAAAGGVDLAALAVVRVADAGHLLRAADHLARSGGFGLLVLDLGAAAVPPGALARLSGLAAGHQLALLCLTHKAPEAPSLGSPVSLRAAAVREPRGDGLFACSAQVLKDKRCAPGWGHTELCRGPDGLR